MYEVNIPGKSYPKKACISGIHLLGLYVRSSLIFKPIKMKKTFVFALLAICSVLFISAGSKTAGSPKIVKQGYQTVTSANGNSVTVYVDWNTSLPLGSRVDQVAVIDPGGVTTYTVTSWEQYPRMDLVSGALVASGWRCNFNPGSDYAILNGNLTMY
jgi:hypothetical protein